MFSRSTRVLVSKRSFSSISETDPVAFLGLGAMGYNMAGNMAKNTDNMLVWNRTRSVAERHAKEHGTNVMNLDTDGSLPQLGDVRAVFMCLPTSDEVDLVLKQTSHHLRPGTIVVDCTSGNPKQSRDICDRLMQDHGVHFVDCAVSGGPAGAGEGTLGAFIGADEEKTYLNVEEDIRCFAKKLVHLGPASSGHATKAINNVLNVTNLLCCAEGLLALRKLGISPDKALAVINESSGRSLQSTVRIPTEVISREFNYGFQLGLMQKDVNIANSIMDENFHNASISRNTKRLMDLYLEEQPDAFHKDYTEICKILEIQSGAILAVEDPEVSSEEGSVSG